MEQHIISRKSRKVKVTEAVYADIIRAYCREFDNWSFFAGLPKYDNGLREGLSGLGAQNFIQIVFSSHPAKVFVPIDYQSLVGAHGIVFPVLQRLEGDSFSHLDVTGFLKMVEREAYKKSPGLIRKDARQMVNYFVQSTSEKHFEDILSALNRLKLPSADSLANEAVLRGRSLEVLAKLAIREYLKKAFWEYENNYGNNEISFPGESKMEASWMEWVLFGKLIPLIGELGRKYGVCEKELLKCIYEQLVQASEETADGAATDILSQRFLTCPLHLLGALGRKMAKVPNPLHLVFTIDNVLSPNSKEVVFERYFPHEDTTVTIRPVAIDRDLEMLHEWFHRDHAKPIWQMDWPLERLEAYYRGLLPNPFSHSFIGEMDGEPTFNVEVYWPTRDLLGDYYDVSPDDYGTHLFIAPTQKEKKRPSLVTQSIVDWLFRFSEIKRLVGEGSVDSLPALMNKVQAGFRLQGIIEMPHKKAHLNTCYREWYWEKFPQNRQIENYITILK